MKLTPLPEISNPYDVLLHCGFDSRPFDLDQDLILSRSGHWDLPHLQHLWPTRLLHLRRRQLCVPRENNDYPTRIAFIVFGICELIFRDKAGATCC